MGEGGAKKPTIVRHLPTVAFGYTFTHIPDHAREDLKQLEREGVIYADQWIDDLHDVRHVKIALTADEAKDYARRTWGFELWLRAGQPTWVRDVPGIDSDIAESVDTYSLRLPDGTIIPPPYHCYAAFLGRHLEAISCGMVPERRTIVDLKGKEAVLLTLSRAVRALTPTIRSFSDREKGLPPWPVTREDDVRDLLYVMLKPSLFDLVKEEPTPSLAATYKFSDLCSKASRFFIEVKWIGRRRQWKAIVGEIQIDIQSYPTHASCETLVFVVVDAARDIPDPRLVEQELTGRQTVRGREIDVRVFVVEP